MQNLRTPLHTFSNFSLLSTCGDHDLIQNKTVCSISTLLQRFTGVHLVVWIARDYREGFYLCDFHTSSSVKNTSDVTAGKSLH